MKCSTLAGNNLSPLGDNMKPLITRKESARYPGLFVKKYTKRVFYDNLWDRDEELLESRGHVETADGKIVIKPFTKIFNHHENGTNIDRDEQCVAICKVNGFMACATYVAEVDDVVISTTGSLDSDFVKMAEEHLVSVKSWIRLNGSMLTTYMFEIVDPRDPHIIQEEPGAYLIGCRFVANDQPYFSDVLNESLLDILAEKMGVKRPMWSVCRFNRIVEAAKNAQHEGFVVYGQTSRTALKIKTPYYLMLKAAARKKDIMSLNKQNVDEEFYDLIEHLRSIESEFNAMDEQSRLDYMRKFLTESVNI